MIGYLVAGGVAVTFGMGIAWYIGTYNAFKTGKVNINTQFSNIKTEYQRRCDLFYNLVQGVKSFKNHERHTLREVMLARSGKYWDVAKGEAIQKMGQLEKLFSRLLMVKEAYPELKANRQHEMLMEEIRLTEDRISIARTDYNKIVNYYNSLVVSFPSNIIAKKYSFKEEEFFELITDGAEEAPKIKL